MRKWNLLAAAIILPPLGFMALLYARLECFAFDPWFAELKEWQGAMGIYGGFLVAVSAALFNAALGRSRDDRMRKTASTSLSLAIAGQVMVVAGLFHTRHQFMASRLNDAETYENQGVDMAAFEHRVLREATNLECTPADLSILPLELIDLFYKTKTHIHACESLAETIVNRPPHALLGIPDAERVSGRFKEHAVAVNAARKAFNEYGETGTVPEIEEHL